MIEIGTQMGRYEIIARLRSGGMATLYLGRDVEAPSPNRFVAIKVVHHHLSDDHTFIKMFLDEAKLARRINHENVVRVEHLGKVDGRYFLAMEYIHGCSLSQLLRSLARLRRRLTPELAVNVAVQVAEGLHAAHETTGDSGELLGVVHRDVSPQNILLTFAGHAKLIDFGIAKARGRAMQTTTGSLKGKIRYMSPEQAFGKSVDRRTDVYALAIVLWETLTMRRLFSAENDFALLDKVRDPQIEPPTKFVPQLAPKLDAAIMKALATNPDERPATAREFGRLLREALPSAMEDATERLRELLSALKASEVDRDWHTLSELGYSEVSRQLRMGELSAVARGEASQPSIPSVSAAGGSARPRTATGENASGTPPRARKSTVPPPIPADAQAAGRSPSMRAPGNGASQIPISLTPTPPPTRTGNTPPVLVSPPFMAIDQAEEVLTQLTFASAEVDREMAEEDSDDGDAIEAEQSRGGETAGTRRDSILPVPKPKAKAKRRPAVVIAMAGAAAALVALVSWSIYARNASTSSAQEPPPEHTNTGAEHDQPSGTQGHAQKALPVAPDSGAANGGSANASPRDGAGRSTAAPTNTDTNKSNTGSPTARDGNERRHSSRHSHSRDKDSRDKEGRDKDKRPNEKEHGSEVIDNVPIVNDAGF